VASIHFLGTGAAGGTPGEGRSERRESSALIQHCGTRVLIDVTRHFSLQAAALDRLDAVLLTHAHRDAAGGVAQLRAWLRGRGHPPVPVYAAPSTLEHLSRHWKRLDHILPVPLLPGRPCTIGPCAIDAIAVPHARHADTPTYAWRVTADGWVVVYASDVARMTRGLRAFAHHVTLLVIDGAMWRRRLFSHLTIDDALPVLCEWEVERIAITQIGRSVPTHERLVDEVHRRCARAFPAYDGLVIGLDPRAA